VAKTKKTVAAKTAAVRAKAVGDTTYTIFDLLAARKLLGQLGSIEKMILLTGVIAARFDIDVDDFCKRLKAVIEEARK